MTFTAAGTQIIGWNPGMKGCWYAQGTIGGSTINVGYTDDEGTTKTPFTQGTNLTAFGEGFRFTGPTESLYVTVTGGTPNFRCSFEEEKEGN